MGESIEPFQRLGPLAGLPALLEELGVDPAKVFAGSGIDAESLTQESLAPFSVAVSLLERAADVANCPHLGLLLGARHDHTVLGPLGRLMSLAPTLGDALHDYVGVQMAYSRGAVVYLARIGPDYALGYGVYRRDFEGGRHVYDLSIAIACQAVRTLTQGRAQISEIHMNSRPPQDVSIYRNILGAPVLFNQDQACIVLPPAALATPLPNANAAEWANLRRYIQQKFRTATNDLPSRVRHVLRPRLMFGEAGMNEVAQELGVHPRTLSRKLHSHGLSFEGIRDEVRFAVARELLELTDMPVGGISDALSYGSHSAFVHAFNRWTGTSPSQWRQDARGE